MYFFVAKLLSNAEMTYNYVSTSITLKPTSDGPANLLRTHRMNFSMRPQHVRMA